ncbi:hypothetical protein DXG03_007228 [Asterophora parasitica]|uniref:Uncharacterized protein n=1 Tax=Asterophora parasitica TaxID=117018 RepID=A0A9P7G8V4_9AGAR|nr:hypothetical protein DXG03_007228 [Asterophora parasitica]
MQANAIESNKKLFGLFSRKLSTNDSATYNTYCTKIAAWLSDERAYYPEARPEVSLHSPVVIRPFDQVWGVKILNILKIAQTTLRRHVGANPDLKSLFHISACIDHPMVAPYALLCRATYPFRDRFEDPDMHAEIKVLLKTITAPSAKSSGSTSINPTTAPPSHNPPTQAIQSGFVMQPAPSPLTPAPQMPHGLSVSDAIPGPSVLGRVHLPTPPATALASTSGMSTFSLPSVTGSSFQTNGAEPLLAPAVSPSVQIPSLVLKTDPGQIAPVLSPQPRSTSSPAPVVPEPDGLHVPRPSLLPSILTPADPALSKPKRKKKKKKISLGFESLIQADLEQLRNSGVKPETLESTILSEDGLTAGAVSVTQTTVISTAQPEVIDLQHEEPPDPAMRRSKGVDSSMVVDGVDIVATRPELAASADEPMHAAAEALHEQYDNDEAMAVDKVLRESPKEHDKGPLSAPMHGDDDGDDVGMSDGTTEISAQPTKVDTQNDQQQPETAHMPLFSVGVSVGPPATTQIVELPDTVQNQTPDDVAPAASSTLPDGTMDAFTEGLDSTVPHEGREGRIPDTTRNKSEVEATRAIATDASQESALPFQQFDSLSSVSEDILPGPSILDGSRASPSGTISVVAPTVPVALRTMLPPPSRASRQDRLSSQSVDGVDSMPAVRHRLPLRVSLPTYQPLQLQDSITSSQVSLKPSVSSSHTPETAPNTSEGFLLGAITPASEPAVNVHTAEELKALYAFPQETIFAIHKGLEKACKAKIQFNIPELQFQAVSLWNTRKIHTQDLDESVCLTLSCYSRATVRAGQKTKEEVANLPSIWPTTGGLSMNVTFKSKKTNCSLSPPFIVEPNGLVDVSGFVVNGQNAIELQQTTDMSAYILILRAHHPTGAQLQQVALRRQKNRAWDNWLNKMAQPLNVPLPSFSDSTS